ncbi:MAG: hypothetical protein HN673_18690, partial [Rhodospirillales bacterium]|nr:hypothetical protein [Rhodospirillales bacterium]
MGELSPMALRSQIGAWTDARWGCSDHRAVPSTTPAWPSTLHRAVPGRTPVWPTRPSPDRLGTSLPEQIIQRQGIIKGSGFGAGGFVAEAGIG